MRYVDRENIGKLNLLEPSLLDDLALRFPHLTNLCFTSATTDGRGGTQAVHTFATVRVHSMRETIEHRAIRSKHSGADAADAEMQEHVHVPLDVQVRRVEPVTLPTFLFEVNRRISCDGRQQ